MSMANIPTLNTASDFNQWLHAMKMVARLPGGTPPEFRRKLWLALADRYLHTSGIDWNKEQAKCLSEAWLDDDEELGIQIVKDLHRTGSSLFSGPNGNLNQAKLKCILLGFARWNPQVGYCQGFNMLGALILQVMDKSETEALKVMIYLIEGVLPKGYFSDLSGLQVDMSVFREILSTRLPKLSKHLQRLQGPVGEGSLEPPLINVFTMQWFLTLFCTCLPTSCVLRVWDLVLIEGSDILLRTALAIWALLAERIMKTKSADEFYCKMGTLSGELLNGHLFDSNGLIQRIVELGPIADLQKMRDKHLFNITPWKDRRKLRILCSGEDVDSEDETWKFMTGARRASLGLSAAAVNAAASAANRNTPLNDTRDRIALDISLLKKQYAKLRERQRQAHIILTNAAKQTVNSTANNNAPQLNVNQYLIGRNAIISNKGRRIGPPAGAIPPARVSQPISVSSKQQLKRLRNATIENANPSASTKRSNDENFNLQKSPSVTSSMGCISSSSDAMSKPAVAKKFFARKRSESSSYDEDSDNSQDDIDFDDIGVEVSSTDTSLCDEDVENASSMEASPMKRVSSTPTSCGQSDESRCSSSNTATSVRDTFSNSTCRKHSDSNTSLTTESKQILEHDFGNNSKALADSNEVMDSRDSRDDKTTYLTSGLFSAENPEAVSPVPIEDLDLLTLAFRERITSTSQLSPIADIAHLLSASNISPLITPSECLLNTYPLCDMSFKDEVQIPILQNESTISSDVLTNVFQVNDEGVTNEYFERINSAGSERSSQVQMPNQNSGATSTLANPVPMKSDGEDIVSNSYGPTSDVLVLPTCFELISSSPDKNCDMSKEDMHNLPKKESSNNFQHIHDCEIDENPGAASLTIAQVEPNDMCLSPTNRKTERISKIIEENSKILDRMMCKNAKSSTDTLVSEQTKDMTSFEFEKNFPVVETSTPTALTKTSHDLEAEKHIIPPVEGSMTDASKKFESNNEDKKLLSSLDVDVEPSESVQAQTNDRILPDLVPHTVEEIIMQAIEKSSPKRPTTILDISIEDDLQSLLKMSAELLLYSDESPTVPAMIASINSATDFLSNIFLQSNCNDPTADERIDKLMSTDVTNNLTMTDQENYEDVPSGVQTENSINDISATISSIKNTIKSIDVLCQDDNRRSRDRADKTLNEIIKVVEQMEDEGKQKKHIEDISESATTIVPKIVEHRPRNDQPNEDDNSSRYLSSSRMSRDRSRMSTHRQRKYDDFGEFESRVRRSKSPFDVGEKSTANNRYSDDFTKKYNLDAFKSHPLDDMTKSSAMYRSNEKLEIRHTTVTSTFYDRFLSQKLEKQHKIDRSPSSPTITRSYLDTLRPTSYVGSSYPDSELKSDRCGSKSSESSPIRENIRYIANVVDSNSARSNLSLMLSHDTIIQNETYARSCENIPSNVHKAIVGPEEFLKNSRDATTSIASLPIKPKKPSELGIKLGLYKENS